MYIYSYTYALRCNAKLYNKYVRIPQMCVKMRYFKIKNQKFSGERHSPTGTQPQSPPAGRGHPVPVLPPPRTQPPAPRYAAPSKLKSCPRHCPDQGLCPWTPLRAPPPDPLAFSQHLICHYTTGFAVDDSLARGLLTRTAVPRLTMLSC